MADPKKTTLTDPAKPDAADTTDISTSTQGVIITPPPVTDPVEPPVEDDVTENSPVDNVELIVEDELTALKKRALFLGLTFHPAIGLEKLRDKVNLYLRSSGSSTEPDVNEIEGTSVKEVEVKVDKPAEYTFEELQAQYHPTLDTPGLSKAQLRNIALKDANKLVRVRITCMNPNKRDWAGEIFTISNSLVGTFKKYVPFNATEGYHVPHIIYQAILERKCQVFVTGTDSRGQRIKKAASIQEFGVEVLPALTTEELKALAQRQAMANGTGA